MNTRKFIILTLLGLLTSCYPGDKKSNPSNDLILEKMNYVTTNFGEAVNDLRYENKNLMKRIQQEVKNKGNRSVDLEIVESGKKVIQMTDELFSSLTEVKSELKGISEQNLSSIDQQNNYMLTQRNGERIKKLLNNYVNKLNDITSNRFEHIIPELGAEYNELELFFKNSPAIASVGTLITFENQIITYERSVLSKYAMLTGTR
ncbi:hypothetical protein E1176_01855 [Fulvivirga sp. RKSG066]|uniref:hypothetical protein n=1 Tax=Fulvivirga aurantia TaxID=2529383 RepID=UPI0012BC6DE9|nr:hypothetical protein [Fulvivirga aurantia]MTI19757.1 hypothetical protein [Fulvivirga aurantia]